MSAALGPHLRGSGICHVFIPLAASQRGRINASPWALTFRSRGEGVRPRRFERARPPACTRWI